MSGADRSVEYGVALVDQLRGMSEQGRARALAELRCARCKQHRAELGPEQRLCYVCRVEVRAADPSERQGR